MSTVLLTWEAGGGLGHLANLGPIANGLSAHGHRVFVALRELRSACAIFNTKAIALLQAPAVFAPVAAPVDPPMTFAHVLLNVGFADFPHLNALAMAWRQLFEFVQPDCVILDHSPIALLAMRGLPGKRVPIGTGFFIPLPLERLPNLRTWLQADEAALARDEHNILDRANAYLATHGQCRLSRLTDLYREVDETFLTTFQELDHYGARPGATYCGAWPYLPGQKVSWPDGQGKRIFAYLKSFPALGALLQRLKDGKQPTVVCLSGVPQKITRRFASKTLSFCDSFVDLHYIAETCELAILNGTHGTTVAMLLAGKPTLQIPIYLEQGMFTDRVVQLGAAKRAPADDGAKIVGVLEEMLQEGDCQMAAERFASRYCSFNPETAIAAVVQRIEELIA